MNQKQTRQVQNENTNDNEMTFDKHYVNCIEYQGCGNSSASESGRKFVIENRSKIKILKYKIDGGLINDDNEIKCDYGFYTANDVLYLVELKGSDYGHAIDQIINTIKLLLKKPHINVAKVNSRIVVSKITQPELCSSNEKKLKIMLDEYCRDKDNLKKQSIQMTETL
ncbi:MAG: hypothetical protein IKO56_08525 [Alphaproteobacteria bacterium]|nr:hypothetical protein [Alphaproteobacteria bacterium]